jgi:hypothetical protein
MKRNTIIFFIVIFGLMISNGCEKQLEEEVFSQLDPTYLFASANGIERVLFGAYRDAQIIGNLGNNVAWLEEWTTDIGWETGGGANRHASLAINFTWDASNPTHFINQWNNMYASIRNCNLVLENIDESPVQEEIKNRLIAEARFVRASAYYYLYTMHGSVPLRKSTLGALELARATEQEMQTFLEEEFTAAKNGLPEKGEISGYFYGRATKGAALGFLTKFYLNTKQWQKCADAAQELILLGNYELWPDYYTLFTVDNEEVNDEYIFVYGASATTDAGNEYINGAFPPQYHSKVDGTVVFTSNMRNWARQDRLYDAFYNSFDPNDIRRQLIISEYINSNGDTVSLLNEDNTRAFKFLPDPNAVGNEHGNDFPVIRYADILLSRAEALNEINGPNQEALDLINEVRNRAGLPDLVLADFSTKESLRDHILDERGWEFYTEKLRRQDLIRHGKFISSALARGVTHADQHHTVFPIPQEEINANPACEQSSGY